MVFFGFSSPAFALGLDGDELSEVLNNIIESISDLPGLLAALSYLLALVIGVTAIFKVKDHVENPGNTPLRVPMIRFLIAGALIALPIIYETMFVTISGDEQVDFESSGNWGSWLSGLLGLITTYVPLGNFNNLLSNMINAIRDIPGFISAVSYLLALILGVVGILKIKEHVENPDNVPLREGVIRLLAGGALFALPMIYSAMQGAVEGDGSLMNQITSLLGPISVMRSGYAGGINPIGGLCIPSFLGGTMGGSLCNIILNTGAMPAFLLAIGYVIGLVLGVWGILKIRDHVLDPSRTSVWEGLARFLAGGLFFALPMIVEVVRSTVTPLGLIPAGLAPISLRGYHEQIPDQCRGLDGALACFMSDMLGPMNVVLNFFAFIAGMIFIMIGISRLLKSAQEGAKAPGGIGTIMTFVAGGALISYNEMIRAFTATLGFGIPFLPQTAVYATIGYMEGMTDAERIHAHTVISAILKFLIVVGLISFVRGIFIIRGVAEGNGQSSLMAGITHMVGGALAVNLGPLLNAVQATLGITQYGISFT